MLYGIKSAFRAGRFRSFQNKRNTGRGESRARIWYRVIWAIMTIEEYCRSTDHENGKVARLLLAR